MATHTHPVFSVVTGETSYVTETIEDFIPPALTVDDARRLRGALLSASDWTQVADAPVNQAAWATYRQALRDVPQQAGFPGAVIWPDPPV